ncbi:MAG: hypothetical protein MUO26_02885 [Methanotrichaceae archaeon]|nr:hypothetical protein [Methanotrichaceae archaeon]
MSREPYSRTYPTYHSRLDLHRMLPSALDGGDVYTISSLRSFGPAAAAFRRKHDIAYPSLTAIFTACAWATHAGARLIIRNAFFNRNALATRR